MPAKIPADLDRLFGAALNAGDLDGLMALYESGAAFSPEPGQVVNGHAAVREALAGFVAMKPTITLENKLLAGTDDIAVSTAKWKLTATGPDGEPVEMTGHSVEVARKQADGTWRFVIDTPWGLGWD